jgi:hypothetical protein
MAASHAAGARRRFIYLMKNTPRIFQELLARRTQLHAARKTFEKFEADFLFQILNLARKRWLGDAQSARRAPVMLLLADRHKISQMPQFHSDTLSRLV